MKLSGFSGLRGLAALMVVYYHLNQHRNTVNLPEWSWDMYQFTEHIVFVVSVFFIFSGFFRSLSYWKVIFLWGEMRSFRADIRDRFFRIAPLYYVSLLATFLLVWLVQWYDTSAFLRLFSGMTFTSWMSSETFFPVDINGPLWFISFDMVGWLMVSGMMAFLVRVSSWTLRILLIILYPLVLTAWHFAWTSLPWSLAPGIAWEWFPTYNPFLFGLHFYIGLLLGGAIMFFRERKVHILNDIFILLMTSVWAYMLWNIRSSDDWSHSMPIGPYHFPYSAIIFWLICFSLPLTRYLARWFDNRILIFYGRISYALYLIHMLIIFLLRKYIFLWEQLWFYNWSLFAVCALLLSTAIAAIISRYIEYIDYKSLWWKKKPQN